MALIVNIIFFVVISQGALAWNPTLAYVGVKRQWVGTAYSIPMETDVVGHECRIGVPNSYGYLIGQQVWFLDQAGVLYGPWLVTDVEGVNQTVPVYSVGEKGESITTVKDSYMDYNGLAADVDCEEMVHKRGMIITLLGVGW